MKLLSVIGARPQFVKCALLSKELRKHFSEILVHTGQHYDDEMSKVFFDELGIPLPDTNLRVGSGTHAEQTAHIMVRLEPLLMEYKPDALVVYGDTNSTLAGALVAAKLHVPVVHVEAGLRSFNRSMPEEVNRIVSDHVATLLCCPTATAVDNLRQEGIVRGVVNTGDVMYDAFLHFKPVAERRAVLKQAGVQRQLYNVLTVHRASNTDDCNNLTAILKGVNAAGMPCIFAIHPRTRVTMERARIRPDMFSNIIFCDPFGYIDFMALCMHAHVIVTDSGGLQKEAYWHGVPCVTVRHETEWVETVSAGWNQLAGTNSEAITDCILRAQRPAGRRDAFGNGNACQAIVSAISQQLQ